MSRNSVFQAFKNFQCFPTRPSENETRSDVPGESVYLNVYDLHRSNGYTQLFGIGIYHSGVEVYGREFGYGGHPHDYSGIFEIRPKNIDELSDECVYNQTIFIGNTHLSEKSIYNVLASLADDFSGRKYHLLKHNCNHFTEAFVKLLCAKSIPGWVNRLATIADNLHFVENFLPPEWIKPPATNDAKSSSEYSDEEFGDEVIIERLREKSKSVSLSLDKQPHAVASLHDQVIITRTSDSKEIQNHTPSKSHGLGPLVRINDEKSADPKDASLPAKESIDEN